MHCLSVVVELFVTLHYVFVKQDVLNLFVFNTVK